MSSASENANDHLRPTYASGTDFLANNLQHDFPSLYQYPILFEDPTASLRNSPFLHPDSYFEEAYVPPSFSPSPPAARFLDNILNPAEEPALPFGYSRLASPSPRRRTRSPTPPCLAYATASMPPLRSARLPNGYVDLTVDPEPEVVELSHRRTKRESPTPGPSAKRLRRNNGTAADISTPPAKIEEIDLSDDKTGVQDILQKQRVDAVKAQQKPEEKATSFKSFTCVICMDTPTDITATSCGHLFCHECLMTALIAGENRSGPNEPKRSQCPVCRKFISRTKAADVIPISLMRQSAMDKQRREAAPASLSKVIG